MSDAHPAESSPGTERQPDHDSPRIYVASLTDYNAGILHGAWLDADDSVEAIEDGIGAMLAASPTAARYGEPAEEWRIDDYEGWAGIRLDSFESLDTIHRLARGLRTHGDAYGAWASTLGSCESEELDEFEERFQGEFASATEYGEQLLQDLGIDPYELPGVPEGLRYYASIDVEGWVRDMRLNGEISIAESKTGVYIFLAT